MADGELFTLKDKYTFLGEECLNFYYYRQDEGGDGAEMLANAFNDNILPLILAVQHGNAVHGSIEVKNLMDDEDFYTLTLTSNNAGALTGETLPKWDAWGFRKNRASSMYRNGAMRLGGISESSQDGGVPISSVLSDLEDLATALGVRLADTNGNSWFLKTPHGSFSGGQIPVPTPISSVQFIRMTTQNSRKR